MNSIEADQFIARCRRVLPEWEREIAQARGEAKEDAIAARDSVLGTLMEIADEFPDKREGADAIAKHHRYGVWAT